MAQIVCVLGNKGGTGKTTLSHMIAHGMGLLGKRVICVLTDVERERLCKDGRKYLPLDAREPAALDKTVTTLNNVDDWYGVIDGGGNRPDVDSHLAGLADLVILPFRDSHEDIRTAIRDLEWLPRAWGQPNQWPANAWARKAADKAVETMMADYASRILPPLPSLSSSKLLLQDEVPARLPSALNTACVALAVRTFGLLGVDIDEAASAQVTGASTGRAPTSRAKAPPNPARRPPVAR